MKTVEEIKVRIEQLEKENEENTRAMDIASGTPDFDAFWDIYNLNCGRIEALKWLLEES